MLQIPKKITEEIVRHAKEESPLEACGYLAGQGETVSELYKMSNVDQSKEHFSFEPSEQFKVIKAARQKNQKLLAVYHSHPASPARLSDEDIRLAFDAETVYVIYSLLNNETKAFRVIDGEIKPVEIEVIL